MAVGNGEKGLQAQSGGGSGKGWPPATELREDNTSQEGWKGRVRVGTG